MKSGRIVHERAVLDWAVAIRSKGGAPHCGDGFLLQRDAGVIMAAVVDGTGSGVAARDAATACLAALENIGIAPIDRCFDAAHDALRNTRGAALAIALLDLDRAQLDWAAVGEVDGVLFRAPPEKGRESVMQRGGTMGLQYGGIHRQKHPMGRGDLLMLTSDGVSGRHRDAITTIGTADQSADLCMRRFGRSDDDAIVLALKLGAV